MCYIITLDSGKKNLHGELSFNECSMIWKRSCNVPHLNQDLDRGVMHARNTMARPDVSSEESWKASTTLDGVIFTGRVGFTVTFPTLVSFHQSTIPVLSNS